MSREHHQDVTSTRQKECPTSGVVGDGKIFVTYVEDAFTIRAAENREIAPDPTPKPGDPA